MRILDKYTKEEIIEILNDSKSFRDFLIKIGSSYNGTASYVSIKKQLTNLNIDIPKYIKVKSKKSDSKSDDLVFIENSTYSRYCLKERIIKNKIFEYICLECGNNGFWNKKKISLHLEHKNGVNNDNRLDNLCFLCPNCHSQTDTYSGKKNKKDKIVQKNYKRKEKYCECGNKIHRTSNRCHKCAMSNLRKIERPNYNQIIQNVDEFGYSETGRIYGVSDNTIRKWIKKYESEYNENNQS